MTQTVTLYDPTTGQGTVWNEADVEAKLSEGLVTQDDWQNICALKIAEERAAWLTSSDTLQERFCLLRDLRDMKLSATDYLLAADYPVSPEKKEAVIAYRQALRDLPGLEGAPWDGGGALTPCPEMPAIAKVTA